jgi:hypothetical protein
MLLVLLLQRLLVLLLATESALVHDSYQQLGLRAVCAHL